MKFFIDTANVAEIKEAVSIGVIDGVTTNPSLVAREKRDFRELITEICGIVDGPISAEVVSMDMTGMVQEGLDLSAIDREKIVVKLPMTKEAPPLTKTLFKESSPRL